MTDSKNPITFSFKLIQSNGMPPHDACYRRSPQLPSNRRNHGSIIPTVSLKKKVMQKLQPIERFIMDSAQTCSPGTFGLKWNSRYAFCLEMFCFSFWSRITDVPDPTGLTNIKWSYQNTLTAATKSTFADLWVVFRLFWSFWGRIQ